MLYFPKVRYTSLRLATLLVLSFISSNTSLGADATINLSIARSNIFAKEMPDLSTSNPLIGDEQNLNFEISEDILQYASNYQAIEESNGFFRRIENLRNIRLEVEVLLTNGQITRRVIDLNSTLEDTIPLSNIFFRVHARLRATADVYRCLEPNVCVFEGTRLERMRMIRESIFANQVFQTTMMCRDVRLGKSISHPSILRLALNPTLARVLKLEQMIFAEEGPQLFSANLENFGFNGRASFRDAKLELVRENNGLTLRMNRPDGGWYDAYVFENCRLD